MALPMGGHAKTLLMRRELPSLPRLVFGASVVLGVVTAGLAGCGSRGPLDLDDPNGTGTGAKVPDAGSPSDSPPDAQVPVDDASVPPPTPDAAPPKADAGPIQTVIECGSCVAKSCGDKILACIASESCRGTFQCVASTCLASGSGVNIGCLLGCAGKDPAGALAVLDVFTCLTATCGSDCGSILDLLGKLGGLGGNKNLTADPGADEQVISEAAFRAVTSRWPELLSHDATPTGH